MKRRAFLQRAGACVGAMLAAPSLPGLAAPARHTRVAVDADRFLLNGRPTYEERSWRGHRLDGLLMNARLVQGIFDDLNPATQARWAYPDTGRWDPERNTREFLAAMPMWQRHGLNAFTLNLQGGSPQGYSQAQPWHNSAFAADGSLRAPYLSRLARILDRADALGMVVILGYFYFGQDERLADEAAVIRATRAATDWLLSQRYTNVIIEVANECDVPRYDHPILTPSRIPELVELVRSTRHEGRRLLAGTSFGGGAVPTPAVVAASDFLLLHGNGVSEPPRIAAMVERTREVPGYRPMPILFNEDDHFDFGEPVNNFEQALSRHASWGFFDPGESNYRDGYQCPPINWAINTPRKQAFFALVREMTGVS